MILDPRRSTPVKENPLIICFVKIPTSANPVKPPKVNKNKKPIAKSIGVLGVIDPVHKVATQLNILIPVGNAITDVTEVN